MALLSWVGYAFAQSNSAAVYVLLGIVAALLLVAFGGGRSYSRITFRDGQFHGRLLVAFHEDSFPDLRAFKELHRRPRSKASQVGRQNLSGGKLTFSNRGMTWKAGSFLTPHQLVEGGFEIKWTEIDLVDVGDAPMKLRTLGGAVTIRLKDGLGQIEGEFLGSHKLLLAALYSSPLGRASRK